ncbi:MAG: TRAP transporter large permease subunit [Paracoccaceae bacterium]|nr:TRAP transporter large permease subunit [Paracoccaceae bacterium]
MFRKVDACDAFRNSGARWGLTLFVIIRGGIQGGVFTPTETAATAENSWTVACFAYRALCPFAGNPGEFARLLRDLPIGRVTADRHPDTRSTPYPTGMTTAVSLFVIANAPVLKHVLTDEQLPQQITGTMHGSGHGPIAFLIVANLILLIGSQFMEPLDHLEIVAPLGLPVGIEPGIDPIHLGFILVVSTETSMVTPPVELGLFVTSGAAAIPVLRVIRSTLSFLRGLFVFPVLVTYDPWLSTVPPSARMGPEIVTR